MKTIDLSYDDVHQLVDARKNAFWDGWTAVFVDPRYDGFMQKNGIYYREKWSIQYRSQPNEKGMWGVPITYV